jgi:hypothetical protein
LGPKQTKKFPVSEGLNYKRRELKVISVLKHEHKVLCKESRNEASNIFNLANWRRWVFSYKLRPNLTYGINSTESIKINLMNTSFCSFKCGHCYNTIYTTWMHNKKFCNIWNEQCLFGESFAKWFRCSFDYGLRVKQWLQRSE